MQVKYFVDSLDGVPEIWRPHYIETDGGYRLDVEGGVAKAEVDRLRNLNIEASVEVEQLRSKVNGKAREMRQRLDALEAQEEAQERHTGTAGPRDSKSEVSPDESENATAGPSAWAEFEERVRLAAVDQGAHRTGLRDVVNRTRARFRLEDGELIPHSFL